MFYALPWLLRKFKTIESCFYFAIIVLKKSKMNNSYELQSKVILDRILQSEKNAKNIVESVASLNRKESK